MARKDVYAHFKLFFFLFLLIKVPNLFIYTYCTRLCKMSFFSNKTIDFT